MKVIVDTSIWIEYLKNNHEIAPELDEGLLTGKLSFKMKEKGVTIAITDCVIAAIATNNGAAVYTLDQDFQSIPDVELYNEF